MADIPAALAPSPEVQAPVQQAPQAPVDGAQVYDISGHQPVLGNIPHDQVEDAISSGKYSFPKGDIKVVSPEGQFGSIPADQAGDAFKSGYKYATPDMLHTQANHEKYGTGGQQAITAVEGAGEGLAGPLAPGLEKFLGVDPEDIKGRAEENPWSHGLGETAGFGAGMLTGTGEAALLTRAGEAVGQGAEALGIGNKVAQGAAKMAAEIGLMQAGDETSKYILDAPTSVGSALTNIGMASLMGAATGGTLSGLGMLGGKTIEKLGLQEFSDRLKTRLTGADPAEAIKAEAKAAVDSVNSANDELWGPQGLKAQAMGANMPEMSEKIVSHVQDISSKAQDAIDKMAKQNVPERFITKAQSALSDFQEIANAPGASSGAIFDAAQDFKKTLQGYSKGNFGPFAVPSYHEAYDFLNITKNLGHDIRTGLENPEIWGKAAGIQKDLNGAFSSFKPALDDFKSKFMSKIEGEHVLDPSKIDSYLKNNGKVTDTSIRQKMMGNFVEKFDRFQKVVDDIYTKAGVENPNPVVGLGALRETLQKPSPWVKAADKFYESAMSHAGGEAVGTGVGGLLGHTTGLPGAGWAGAYLGGKLGDHILPSILQPLMEKVVNAHAFEAAMKMGENAVKGQKLIQKTAESIFKGALYPQVNRMMPDQAKLDKLDKKVTEYSQNPQKLLPQSDNKLGHYMPNHAEEAAALSGRTVQYLNSLKPQAHQASALDTKIEPSKSEMSGYYRQLAIAEQPLSIMQHIKDGTLIPQDIKTLQTVSPALYNKMSQQLHSEMISHLEAGHNVPYQLRQNLSLFLGSPLDSTMQPMSIMAAQSAFMQKPQAQPPGAPKRKGTSALGKSNSQYMTAGQSAEADRSNRE